MKSIWLSLALALTACPKAPSRTTTPSSQPAAADDPTCPLFVPGTSVSVEDTTSGAALVFVTTGDPLGVRARAAALADMHTKHDGPPNAMGMMFTPGTAAIATEIDGGARVEFTAAQPDVPASVANVQKELRMHASHLTGGTCEM